MGANHRAVDETFLPINIKTDGLEQVIPDPGCDPTVIAFEDRVPVAVAVGQASPLAA